MFKEPFKTQQQQQEQQQLTASVNLSLSFQINCRGSIVLFKKLLQVFKSLSTLVS